MRRDTLYVSDMDGTLLGNDSLVSHASAAIISELSRDGAMITVATARTPATVDPLLRGAYTTVPAVVMTGASLWDRTRRRLVDTVLLGPGVAADLAGCFARHGIDPFVYTVTDPSHLDVYHGVGMTPAEDDFYRIRRNLELKKFHIGSRPGPDTLDSTILLFAIGDTAPITAIAAELSGRGDCSVSCYPDLLSPARSLIEVFHHGVSKARAVTRLADAVGALRVVVFGDNLNDLSMMSVADVAVAVGNAFPQVREAADIVIGPNSADSVAHFIEND